MPPRRPPQDDWSNPPPAELVGLENLPARRHSPARNPRPQTPDRDPTLRPERNPRQSLVEGLGGVVDQMRQLYTAFGLRPYRVFSVVVRWTGGRIGYGEAVRESVEEIRPTPKVDLSGLDADMKSAGRTEAGTVRITQISPRYTEDDIRGLFFLQPLPPGRQGFWEVRIDSRDGQPLVRRIKVYGVPWRRAERFGWECRFIRQDEPPTRTGAPSNIHSPAEVLQAELESRRRRW